MAGLQQLSVRRFLLTKGFRRFQESKIRQLGLAQLFEAIYVDALDPPGPRSKLVMLKQLLLEHSLAATEVIVVGDRAEDELAAARDLGMTAVQILRPGVVPDPDVQWRITDLTELPALLVRLARDPRTLHD